MNAASAVCFTIVLSIFILSILAYNLVDRILDHREHMADDYKPEPDVFVAPYIPTEPAPLDKIK